MITARIWNAKKHYFRRIFGEAKCDSKKTWNILNNILKSHKVRNENLIKSLVVNGSNNESASQICEELKNHFVSTGRRIVDSIPAIDPLTFDSIMNRLCPIIQIHYILFMLPYQMLT